MTGRPTKCTPELLAEFGRTLRTVLYIETACDLHGISSDSYRRWIARGEAELARVAADGRRRVREAEQPFVDFCGICARARAEAERSLLAAIKSHGLDDWKANAWMLERAFPFKWGKREKEDSTAAAPQELIIHLGIPGAEEAE